jgi:predicted RNA-binding protein with PIN domain
MKHYIIDGNNVIHKSKPLSKLFIKDKQSPREKLIFKIEDSFQGRNVKITVHYDYFENVPIKASLVRIIYSDKKEADENIKKQIADEENRRNLIVVSSDNGIKTFARKCGCEVISSEDFIKQLLSREKVDEETIKTKQISNDNWNDIFKE